MIKLSVFLSSLLISFSAQSVTVEGLLHLPWISIQEQLKSSAKLSGGTESLTLTGLTVSSPFGDFNIPSISGAVTYELAPLTFQQGQVDVQTTNLWIGFEVPALTIQRQIQKTIAGVQVIVDVQASCSAIQAVQSQATLKALLKWALQDQTIAGVLSDLNLAWPQAAWTVSPIRCTGPVGFADLIEIELRKQLSDPTRFIQPVQSYLQNALTQKVNTLMAQALKPHWGQLQGLAYNYKLAGLHNLTTQGIDFWVEVQVANNNPEILSDLRDSTLAHSAAGLSVDRPSLVFGQRGFQELLKVSLLQKEVWTPLNPVAGFAKLLRSRFLQFFIWPDLMNFSKKAVFNLNTQILPGSTLRANEDRSWNLDLQLGSWIAAERQGVSWNYLQLQSYLHGQLSLTIEKSQLILTPQLQQLTSKISFGEDYKKRFHPRTAIAKSILEKAVKDSLLNKSQTFQIPTVEFEGLSPYRVEKFGWGVQNEMIFEFVKMPGPNGN